VEGVQLLGVVVVEEGEEGSAFLTSARERLETREDMAPLVRTREVTVLRLLISSQTLVWER